MQSSKDKLEFLLDVCSGTMNIYIYTVNAFYFISNLK